MCRKSVFIREESEIRRKKAMKRWIECLRNEKPLPNLYCVIHREHREKRVKSIAAIDGSIRKRVREKIFGMQTNYYGLEFIIKFYISC